MHARIGMPVVATDGPWGELVDFIVDPTDWHVTHLAVEPHHHHERSHLVPVSSVATSDEQIELTLSGEEIVDAPPFEVTEFVKIDRRATSGDAWTSEANPVTAWPFYPYVDPMAAVSGTGFVARFSSAYPAQPQYVGTTFDHVPDHEVAIRRSSHVLSSDGHTVGTVDGFVFNNDGQITHLVLDHGHLWGHRDVTIPIGHVRHADRDQVRLDATRDAISGLASVRFHRHADEEGQRRD